MNRIDKAFRDNKKIFSIYFTAGYPSLNDTLPILKELQENGVNMIEIGLPFSDPLADGPTIQESSSKALLNGMNTEVLFNQLENMRDNINIPIIIMGYFNPILQYGVEEFCQRCEKIGIDGLIIPDLPVDIYNDNYKKKFDKHHLYNMFLITPQTTEKRINYIDKVSKGFIYMVSSASVTGAKNNFDNDQEQYFQRIAEMKLVTPQVIGFGISNSDTYQKAIKYSSGGIIGSAFIKCLETHGITEINRFIKKIRG
jgi:tryptophan synthase alpha chain